MTGSSSAPRASAFTLVELLVVMGAFGIFAMGVMAVWSSLSISAVNTTSFSQLQNDQMRVLDYLKRDIHRATKVELLNGATVVTSANTFAPELRLTIPDYYADAREEDDTGGTRAANNPALAGDTVTYGTPLTVRFYSLDGAAVRREGDVSRELADASGAFELSFQRETSGAIRARVVFQQPTRGFANRAVRRMVETLAVPRAAFR